MKARYIVATEGVINVAGVYIAPGALRGPHNGDTIPVYDEAHENVIGRAGDLKRNQHTGEVSVEIEWDERRPTPTFSGTKTHFSLTNTEDAPNYIELTRADISELTIIHGDIHESKIKGKKDDDE